VNIKKQGIPLWISSSTILSGSTTR
jgi:hypothetical protein